jgi:hypothetical protein
VAIPHFPGCPSHKQPSGYLQNPEGNAKQIQNQASRQEKHHQDDDRIEGNLPGLVLSGARLLRSSQAIEDRYDCQGIGEWK